MIGLKNQKGPNQNKTTTSPKSYSKPQTNQQKDHKTKTTTTTPRAFKSQKKKYLKILLSNVGNLQTSSILIFKMKITKGENIPSHEESDYHDFKYCIERAFALST